jgi:hypothetical protein
MSHLNSKPVAFRFLLLLSLVSVQIWAVNVLWKLEAAPAEVGFLTKVGGEFVVAWHPAGGELKSAAYSRLDDALRFVQETLHLRAGRSFRADIQLENVWQEDRFGNSVVLWKIESFPLLNQMTFQNSNEASFFTEAFRRGAYAPSPFGHSVLLLPVREAQN